MKRFKIRDKILFFTVLSVCLFFVLIDVFAQGIISHMMESNIYKTINGVCNETSHLIEQKYSADFRFEEGKLFAGEAVLSDDTEFLDTLKRHFDSEVTIFYGNMRCLTTIRDGDGCRLTGTVQDDDKIISAVFRGGTYQSRDVMINGEKYYGVYNPLVNSSGAVCGMVFAGISTESVMRTKKHLFLAMLLISSLSCAAGVFVVSVFTDRLCRDLYYIRVFLDRLSKNEMGISLNEKVLSRNDEIGELGFHSVEISRNITALMNTDPLTHLMNRRSGVRLLESICRRSVKDTRPLTFAMGDIDFFKHVNDTYGHAAGDDVLIKVSRTIKELCPDPDRAVRWGGEEFLLVLHKDCAQALETLEQIRSRVEALVFQSEEGTFRVTITFGVASFEPGEDFQKTIRRADANLYIGKESGRNRIIAE